MPRNYLSGSIKKALAIIECVGKSSRPLKASEVANLTKLERATAFRILTYLTSLGYIFKDITNKLYSTGHKIFEFGEKSDFLKTLIGYSLKYIRQLSIDTQLIEVVTNEGLTSSKGEARRLIKQGAIRVDNEKVTDESHILLKGKEVIIKVGKRRFIQIK